MEPRKEKQIGRMELVLSQNKTVKGEKAAGEKNPLLFFFALCQEDKSSSLG